MSDLFFGRNGVWMNLPDLPVRPHAPVIKWWVSKILLVFLLKSFLPGFRMTAKRLPHSLFSPDSILKCISFVSALPPELYRFKTSISIGRDNCVHRIFSSPWSPIVFSLRFIRSKSITQLPKAVLFIQSDGAGIVAAPGVLRIFTPAHEKGRNYKPFPRTSYSFLKKGYSL